MTGAATLLMGGLSRDASHKRLALSLALSAALLLAGLSHIEFSLDLQRRAPHTLNVALERTAPRPVKKTVELPAPSERAVEESVQEDAAARESAAKRLERQEQDDLADDLTRTEPVVDWHAELRSAAAHAALEAKPKRYMGEWDEKIAAASNIYYASPDSGPKPIWENVEKDQLGRALLWHGDCYRVLSDPNVMNLYVFETFTQHLVFCQNAKHPPRALPFVQDVIARYPHLQDAETQRRFPQPAEP